MALWKEEFIGQLTALKNREHSLFLVFSCVFLWKGSHYILLRRSCPVPLWKFNFCMLPWRFFLSLYFILCCFIDRPFLFFLFFYCYFYFFKYVKRTRRDSSPVYAFPSLLLKMRSWLHGLFTLQLYSWKSLDRPNTEACLCFVLQMVRNFRKPLIVVGPKLLLRLPVRDPATEKRTEEKIMSS